CRRTREANSRHCAGARQRGTDGGATKGSADQRMSFHLGLNQEVCTGFGAAGAEGEGLVGTAAAATELGAGVAIGGSGASRGLSLAAFGGVEPSAPLIRAALFSAGAKCPLGTPPSAEFIGAGDAGRSAVRAADAAKAGESELVGTLATTATRGDEKAGVTAALAGCPVRGAQKSDLNKPSISNDSAPNRHASTSLIGRRRGGKSSNDSGRGDSGGSSPGCKTR